jgi:hypothetical protein
MTDYDALLRGSTWDEVVSHILDRIINELPPRAGSPNAVLGEALKYFFERGATAVLERDARSETGEASGDAAPTRH